MGQTLKEKADFLGISYRTAKRWRANGANLDDPSAVAEYNTSVLAKRYRVVTNLGLFIRKHFRTGGFR